MLFPASLVNPQSPMSTDEPPPPRYTIGYALSPKKQNSFIQPSLLSHAAANSIALLPIDPALPISSQGPFHAIIHKLSSPQWLSNLLSFSTAHPHVPIIDPPSHISRLLNRSSMLLPVNHITLTPSFPHLTLTVPRQVELHDSATLSKPIENLQFPVIAKPLGADSHAMTLIFRPEGLRRLTPPVVLQEFVNHGGVIFKAYVVGEHVCCVKRKSLSDVDPEFEGDAVAFEQISNTRAEGYSEGRAVEEAEMPPVEFVREVAEGLRRELGLRLFNFDVIRDVKDRNRYLVIDINYFPGYAKMPGYEGLLVDFFCGVVGRKGDSERKGVDNDG